MIEFEGTKCEFPFLPNINQRCFVINHYKPEVKIEITTNRIMALNNRFGLLIKVRLLKIYKVHIHIRTKRKRAYFPYLYKIYNKVKKKRPVSALI